MQILLGQNTGEPATSINGAPSLLDGQSARLLGYFDTLLHRLMLARPTNDDEPTPEMSREEMRTFIVLGAYGRVTMTSLAERLNVPLSTATHTIDRLVAKELVVRTRSEQDRRIVQVDVSEFGQKLRASSEVKKMAMARSWLEPLSPGEREIFLELMAKITERAQPSPEGGKRHRPEAR
jgi:DNA-binding MarR family transcriptional regulator